MKSYKKTAIDPNGVQRIQATETSYNEETGAGESKTGFIPFKSDKIDNALAKLRANEWHIEFGARNRAQAGLYEAELVTTPELVESEVADSELATAN